MDCKETVFLAAKEGKLSELKDCLNNIKADEVKSLINDRTNGATPLVMAAKNGHFEVVQFLVENCAADVEFAGSVTFDGERIEGAPPLWCASASGHVDIVKYLIEQTANVNNTTQTNSTPLRSACFDGYFEIVKYLVEHSADIEIANRHGHTCLMISCYKGHAQIVRYLLEKGADVNSKSLKRNTALHDCAESGSVEIMELLLDHRARIEKDDHGMTPLFAAALSGYANIVEFLIRRPEISKLERIEAMELLGETFVDKTKDVAGAIKYWKRAMEERYSDQSYPVTKPTAPAVLIAYEGSVEVQTIEELDKLITDTEEMNMQALLVRERILRPAHPDTSYYIRYRGAVFADNGKFDNCIVLWMYALDRHEYE